MSAPPFGLKEARPSPARTRRSPIPLTGQIDPTNPALIDPRGTTLDHGALRRAVEELATDLPRSLTRRLLIHVPFASTMETVVAYLAVLEAGHAALISTHDPAAYAPLTQAWPVDFAVEGGRFLRVSDSAEPRHVLHPDLALLLSTSGSTGSPKLVRLSHGNIVTNAAAIARALRLTPADRGITSLPLHYCFGLSVLHAHLTVGGSVALTDASVLDGGFWGVVDGTGVTTLAVVPHMVELMETTGVLEREHPSLRLITQAGGRMAPERIVRTAELGRRHGWGLSVMYGQTEATARICIHDPADVLRAPDAVGRPIPGSAIVLDTTVAEAQSFSATGERTGEIVVRGPGVMMGYAQSPDELALGAILPQLRTGDLGQIDDDGFVRIVGRRVGFVKVLGLRIDLARVEQTLERHGLVVCADGDDAGLRVVVEPVPGRAPEELAGAVRRAAARASGVGVAHVRVAVQVLPRRPNGKIDRVRCGALVCESAPEPAPSTQPDEVSLGQRVAATVAHLLGRSTVDLHHSFAAQGGDSLAHVQASVRLTDILGDLPPDWHHRPLAELIERAGQRAVAANASAVAAGVMPGPGAHAGLLARWRSRLHARTVRLETSTLLRAVAVLTIVGTHAGLFHLLGGAHTLLAVAGFNAARFGLSAATVADRWRGTARLAIGLAVPTMLIALVGLSQGRYGWDNVFFVHWLVGELAHDQRNELWFIDALIACLVVSTAVLSIPAVARRWRADPWRVAYAFVLVGLVPRFLILTFSDGVLRGIMPTVFWIFAVGLALAYANSAARRGWTLTAGLLGIAWFFPDQPGRNAVVMGGFLLLALLPAIRVPRLLVPLVTLLGAASLHIYLIQFHLLGEFPGAGVTVAIAIVAGLLFWWLTHRWTRRLQVLVPSIGARPSAAQPVSQTPAKRISQAPAKRVSQNGPLPG